jgi:hypothetical protein
MDEFNHDKHYLSNRMNNYVDLLLFPKTLYESLGSFPQNSALYKLSSYMYWYDMYLILLRRNHKELRQMKRFGYIFGTYWCWNRRINIMIYNLMKYRKKIIELFENPSKKDKLYFRQCSIDISKLYTYMNIHKMTCDYLVYYSEVDEVKSIDYNEIIDLLPVCSFVQYNIVETERPHQLDRSDIVMKKARTAYV